MNENTQECPICMTSKELVQVCPNKHYICDECLGLLINKEETYCLNCPLCRQEITSSGLEYYRRNMNQ